MTTFPARSSPWQSTHLLIAVATWRPIIVSPMPIENYVATFGVKPITEGNRTFVEWMAEFDVGPQDEARIKQQVGRDTFAAGILALEKAVKARP